MYLKGPFLLEKWTATSPELCNAPTQAGASLHDQRGVGQVQNKGLRPPVAVQRQVCARAVGRPHAVVAGLELQACIAHCTSSHSCLGTKRA